MFFEPMCNMIVLAKRKSAVRLLNTVFYALYAGVFCSEAQNATICIKDEEGEPVPYASVYNEHLVTVTQLTGCVKLPLDSVFTVSAVGYKDTAILITPVVQVIALAAEVYELPEVIFFANSEVKRSVQKCTDRPTSIFGIFETSDELDARSNPYLEYAQILSLEPGETTLQINSIDLYSWYNNFRYQGYVTVYTVSPDGVIRDKPIVAPIYIDQKLRKGRWTTIDLQGQINVVIPNGLVAVSMYSLFPQFATTTIDRKGRNMLDRTALVLGPARCQKTQSNVYYRDSPASSWLVKPVNGMIFNLSYGVK